MSVTVSLRDLGAEVRRWGFGYLLTTSDDGQCHVIALMPDVIEGPDVGGSDGAVLRFDAGGGRACRNTSTQPLVTIVFPPRPDGDGFSLLVDGNAAVDGDVVVVRPTGAILHRPAPPLPGLSEVEWGSESAFRARLGGDGFGKPDRRSYRPDPTGPLHGHDTDVRGLVVSGSFVLRMAGGDHVFGPGKGFELARGTEHAESAAEEGATVLIATR